MKRVKIMLLSLTLLAIVGGALAFKAKFHEEFCTSSLYVAGNATRTTCPSFTLATTTNDVGFQTVYTTPAPNQDCTYWDEDLRTNKKITCAGSTSTKAD